MLDFFMLIGEMIHPVNTKQEIYCGFQQSDWQDTEVQRCWGEMNRLLPGYIKRLMWYVSHTCMSVKIDREIWNPSDGIRASFLGAEVPNMRCAFHWQDHCYPIIRGHSMYSARVWHWWIVLSRLSNLLIPPTFLVRLVYGLIRERMKTDKWDAL